MKVTNIEPTNVMSQVGRVAPAPALSLIFLAPFVAEVLSGSTRISYIEVLVPEMMVWGCGALLIREAVRRWGAGWVSMLLLGLALSITEEFIIQQTSLAPLAGTAATAVYGRYWGVNWLYFLFMLVYESVWVVLVPVQVTELVFPEWRCVPWLGWKSIAASVVVFLVGSYIAWYSWVKIARPVVFHMPAYTPPAVTLLSGLAGIVVLGLLAHAKIPERWISRHGGGATPPVWSVVLATLLLSLPWYILLVLVFDPAQRPAISFWVPMVVGVAWSLTALMIVARWSSSPKWGRRHQWALTFGATLACMGGGFLGSNTWLRLDIIGKCVLNGLAILVFLGLFRLIQDRDAGRQATSVSHSG